MADNNNQVADDNDDFAADIEIVLTAVAFPADSSDLVQAARDEDVDSGLIVILEDLPDERYENRDEAQQAINRSRSKRRSRQS